MHATHTSLILLHQHSFCYLSFIGSIKSTIQRRNSNGETYWTSSTFVSTVPMGPACPVAPVVLGGKRAEAIGARGSAASTSGPHGPNSQQ